MSLQEFLFQSEWMFHEDLMKKMADKKYFTPLCMLVCHSLNSLKKFSILFHLIYVQYNTISIDLHQDISSSQMPDKFTLFLRFIILYTTPVLNRTLWSCKAICLNLPVFLFCWLYILQRLSQKTLIYLLSDE